MIRTSTLKGKLPLKELNACLEQTSERHLIDQGWSQYKLNYDHPSYAILHEKVKLLIPTKNMKDCKVSYMEIDCDVDEHFDEMDKSCVIIPLRSATTATFYDEANKVNLEKGKYYTFNDCIMHGLDNPRFNKIRLLVVDHDPRKRRF